MDKNSFFNDNFKVNMGNKKDLTKDQLLAQNRKERLQREVARKEGDAATVVQKFLRSYVSNKKLVKQCLYDPTLKLRESIMVFKAASIK